MYDNVKVRMRTAFREAYIDLEEVQALKGLKSETQTLVTHNDLRHAYGQLGKLDHMPFHMRVVFCHDLADSRKSTWNSGTMTKTHARVIKTGQIYKLDAIDNGVASNTLLSRVEGESLTDVQVYRSAAKAWVPIDVSHVTVDTSQANARITIDSSSYAQINTDLEASNSIRTEIEKSPSRECLMSRMTFRFSDSVVYERDDDSPDRRSLDNAIRIAVTAVELSEEQTARFRVHVTHNFDAAYRAKFSCYENAFVLLLENADTGECVAGNIIDPGPKYKVEPSSAFDPDIPDGDIVGFIGGYCSFGVEIGVGEVRSFPNLYVTVLLQEHQSNTMGLCLGPQVVSYVGGEHRAL